MQLLYTHSGNSLWEEMVLLNHDLLQMKTIIAAAVLQRLHFLR
jgi:hypothetical protein